MVAHCFRFTTKVIPKRNSNWGYKGNKKIHKLQDSQWKPILLWLANEYSLGLYPHRMFSLYLCYWTPCLIFSGMFVIKNNKTFLLLAYYTCIKMLTRITKNGYTKLKISHTSIGFMLEVVGKEAETERAMEASTIMLVMLIVYTRSYLESPGMWLASWFMMFMRIVGR